MQLVFVVIYDSLLRTNVVDRTEKREREREIEKIINTDITHIQNVEKLTLTLNMCTYIIEPKAARRFRLNYLSTFGFFSFE